MRTVRACLILGWRVSSPWRARWRCATTSAGETLARVETRESRQAPRSFRIERKQESCSQASGWRRGNRCCPERCHRPETPAPRAAPAGAGTARCAGHSPCAEEDSNLHPLSVDQALNLVTRVSDPSYASRSSRSSADLDGMDVMDDLDVATDVATGGLTAQTAPPRPSCRFSRIAIASGWSARTRARHAKRVSGQRERRGSLVVPGGPPTLELADVRFPRGEVECAAWCAR